MLLGNALRFKNLPASADTPVTGESALYTKTDGGLYLKNSLGVERPLVQSDTAIHPNPGFETGSTPAGDDWTIFWTSGATWSFDTTTFIEGTRSAKVVSTSAGDTIRVGTLTPFTVVAGSTIKVSVWAKTSSAANLEFSFMTSTPAGNPDYFGSETTGQVASRSVGTSWQRLEASFVVPAGHTKCRIYISVDNNRTWWLDSSGSVVTAQPPVVYTPPYVRMYPSTTQSVASGSWIKLNFPWTLADAQGSPAITHSAGVFTIPVAGLYDLRFEAMFRNDVSSTGVRAVGIYKGGTQCAGSYSPPIAAQGDYASAQASSILRLAAGDVISFYVLQNSGGNVVIHTYPYTQAYIMWLSA